MKKRLLALPLAALILSGCNAVNIMEANRQAVDDSTEAVYRNVEAVQASNRAIRENQRNLADINRTLDQMEKSN